MGFPGDSAADLHRDMRAVLERGSRTDSCGDSESDFPPDSHRDSKADLRRDLQRDFPRDFDGDFGVVLRATAEDGIGGCGERTEGPDARPRSPSQPTDTSSSTPHRSTHSSRSS